MRNRKILEAMAGVTIMSTVTRLLAFIFKIYLSRALGAEILGVYQIAMSVFMLFIALSSSGIPQALSRHIATLNAQDDTKGVHGMVTTALILSTSIALIIMVCCYIFPHLVSLLFSDERCYHMFRIMLPALLSTSIYGIMRSYFWGMKNYALYSGSEFVEEVLTISIVISSIVFGLFGHDLTNSVATAFLISDYVAAFMLVVLFVVCGGRLTKPRLFKPLIRSSVPLTSTRMLGSFISSMMALLIPLMLVGTGMSQANATANYGRASGMVMPLIFIPSTLMSAIAVVIIPELASLKAKGRNLKDHITHSIVFAGAVAVLFLGIFIAVGDRITDLLYHDSIAGQYMIVASFIMVPMTMNQMAVSALNTLGHENVTFRIHIIASIVLTIIILILPKYTYIYAYFIALIIFHTLSIVLYLSKLKRLNEVDITRLKSLILLAILHIIVGCTLKHLLLGIKSDILAIIIAICVLLIIYIIMLYHMKMVKINIIHSLMPKIKKKRVK